MHKKFPDSMIEFALAHLPPGPNRIRAAALAVGCSEGSVRIYVKDWGFPTSKHKVRAAGMTYSRAAPVSPSRPEIAKALKVTRGDCYAAARLLGCSKTPVRNYIVAERAKGHEVGNRRYPEPTRLEVAAGSPAAKNCPKDPPRDHAAAELMNKLTRELLVA